jgi:hypothetical protein
MQRFEFHSAFSIEETTAILAIEEDGFSSPAART